MLSVVLVGIVTLVLVLFLFGGKRRPKNFPPGPPGIPLFGNALQLGISSHKAILPFREKYGDIIGLKFGNTWLVYLNNPDDIRECYGRSEFSGRMGYNGMLQEQIKDANYGLIFSHGEKWQAHRRFTLKTLRDFGFAKRTSEGIIMEEVKETIERLKKREGEPFSTPTVFNVAVFNVIWSIIAGERFDHDDPAIKNLINLFDDFLRSIVHGITPLFFLFPGLSTIAKRVPFLVSNKCPTLRNKLYQFFRDTIQQHRETYQEGSPRDFIDTLLEEEKKSGLEELDMLVTLTDFFAAGSETTSTTLCWAFFLLAQHPEFQEKLVEEIKSVVGNREVALEDRPKLPYVDAATQEIFRVATLTPKGVPHSTTQDTTFKGYFIPKDTVILTNVYLAHFSEEIWGDPKSFRPERFLSADRKAVIRNKAWMPFGVGKRACLGESLARDEFFLFFTNILQNLRISMPEDEPGHSLDGIFRGSIATPEPHKIVVFSRN